MSWVLVILMFLDGVVATEYREQMPDRDTCLAAIHQRTHTTVAPGGFVIYCEGLEAPNGN